MQAPRNCDPSGRSGSQKESQTKALKIQSVPSSARLSKGSSSVTRGRRARRPSDRARLAVRVKGSDAHVFEDGEIEAVERKPVQRCDVELALRAHDEPIGVDGERVARPAERGRGRCAFELGLEQRIFGDVRVDVRMRRLTSVPACVLR